MSLLMHISRRQRFLPYAVKTFSSATPAVAHLEVERKFAPAVDSRQKIESLVVQQNAQATHPSQLWRTQKPVQIEDIYYDLDDKLERMGVWIRFRKVDSTKKGIGESTHNQRCGSWDAKIRLGGDYIDSQVQELQGEDNIRELLSDRLPTATLEGLEVKAGLKTTRLAWIKDVSLEPTRNQSLSNEKLSIVLDSVEEMGNTIGDCRKQPFKHEVGEVELTKTGRCGSIHGGDSEELSAMDEFLHEFMSKNSALFARSKPRGKLSAYFDWKYQTL